MIAFASACSAEAPTEPEPASGETVAVRLQEWTVATEKTSAPEGTVTFEVSNVGEEAHELVVVRSGTGAGAMPSTSSGALDESNEQLDVVDRLEPIDPRDTGAISVDLEPGSYLLVCNLSRSEEDGGVGHFSLGMSTPFLVTQTGD